MNSKRKRRVVVLTLIGSILLLFAIYLFSVRLIFLANANSFDAPVVAVSHEPVPRGRGSVLAYVPMVQVRDSQGRPLTLKVDTFSEEPVYSLGQTMRVVCNPKRGCIQNTFKARWGDGLIDLILSLVFFSPLLYYKFVSENRDRRAKLLSIEPVAVRANFTFIHIESSKPNPPAFPVELYWGDIPGHEGAAYLVNPQGIEKWATWDNEFFRIHDIASADVLTMGSHHLLSVTRSVVPCLVEPFTPRAPNKH